jgi:Bacterial TniB protein
MTNLNIAKPFITNPFITNIINLFDLLRNKRTQFGITSCLLLTGESGSGKSELAKYYCKNNPIFERNGSHFVPVLHYELRSISSPKDFLRGLLIAVGDPQQGQGARNQTELYDRLITLLKTTNIELIILDEIQVIIERRSAKVITGIADLFKDLIEDAKIPIVFMGMPWSRYLIDSNKQLAGRISYRYTIPPYKISDKEERKNYRRLLKLLAGEYGIEKIKLHDQSTTLRMFAATSGNLRATSNLVRDSYALSIIDNKDIDLSLLSETIKNYGVPDDRNPFILPVEKLELHELITHSDWQFGQQANKNSIIQAGYITLGVTKDDMKLYTLREAS